MARLSPTHPENTGESEEQFLARYPGYNDKSHTHTIRLHFGAHSGDRDR